MIKRRQPLVATLLSIIATGLGQMYNGQIMKAFLFGPVSFIITLFFAFSGFLHSFKGFVLYCTVGFLWWLYGVLDALHTSIIRKEISLRRFNKAHFYILFLLAAMMLYVLGQDIVVKNVVGLESFRITLRGMEPTLVKGDFIYVDKKYYNTHQHQINDIALFAYPDDRSAYLLGRVAAIADDYVIIDEDTITVFNHDHTVSKDRKLSHGIAIPNDAVFIVGDNKDVSLDSRAFGPLKHDDIVGKVLYVYWSWDSESFKVRWNRIGNRPQ